MAVSLTISIDQNSQNIANNTSNVTVTARVSWTNGSYNALGQCTGSITIDGTKYSFSGMSFNSSHTSSGTQTVMTKTADVTHNSDGTKTVACSASFNTEISAGTVGASASKSLTAIPRKSTLSVANGTLGTSQTLTVTRQATSFYHSVKAVCGSSTLYIKADGTTQSSEIRHNDCSIPFAPPLSWANQNTTGTSVSVTYTITTYTASSGGTKVGANSYTKTCTMPASVKPSCSITVTDPTGTLGSFGSYVKGISKFQVSVTATTSYGSAIASYSTSANGATYNTATFTTAFLRSSGTLTISATVKDKRGRTGTASTTVSVLNYTEPVISSLTTQRCNEDGTDNEDGEYVRVVFSAVISPLNNANSAEYSVTRKKPTETAWYGTTLTDYADVYSVSGASWIFSAESGSTYDIKVEARDAFKTGQRTTVAPTAFTLMHWKADGTAMAIGKIAEESDLFDVGLATRFNQPVYGKVTGLDRLPEIPRDDELNDYLSTGCWAIHSNANAEAVTCGGVLLGTDDTVPPARAGRFEVISATGEGVRDTQYSYLRQRFTPYNDDNAVWERDVTRGANNVWTYYAWWKSTLTPAASLKVYDKAAMTIARSANWTISAANTYTKIPFNKAVYSTSGRLMLSSNSICIGDNISYVKISGQVLIKCGSTTAARHVRICKTSGSTTTSHSWVCIDATSGSNTVFPLTPVVIPVKSGDLIHMVVYSGDTADSCQSGSSANGYQTFLTVEEL